jgi:transposase
VLRLRAALREFFPAAVAAFPDLAAADALALLQAAPDPASAARLPRTKVVAALKRAGRRGVPAKATEIQRALRAEQLAQPETVVAAYAATVRAAVAVIGTLNAQIKALEAQLEANFGKHPDAGIYLSQPGLGGVLGARVLGEFGDDPGRYRSARARRNYAGTSPVTRQSGKKKTVLARFVRNDRLADPLHQQAFCALTASPGARAYYDQLRARGSGHHAALRQLANRLVGILHGCLKARTPYHEATAWSHRTADAAA